MAYSIAFFGSSTYSVIILEKLLTLTDFTVTAIITKPDKPTGRSQAITANPVAECAHRHQLPLLQPTDFTPDFIAKFEKLKPDVALCVAYGPPFFNQTMIDIPRYKIINIHPSPLPKYRGATPGPWQIINHETTSAVTFFQIDTLPDHGPIITQLPFTIDNNETSESFYSKAFSQAASHLSSVLLDYIHHPDQLTPQDHLQKTYYPKFTKSTAQIDWQWENDKISRFVRAMNPWPVAWTTVLDRQNKPLNMKVFSYNEQPVLVQIEGKKPCQWQQIKNYYRLNNPHN